MAQPDAPVRIALVVPTLAGGGIATVLPVLARGLAERGHGVDLVVFDRSGALAGRVPGTVRLVDLDTRKLVVRSRAFSVEACIGRHLALMAEPRAGRGARDG